MSDLVSILIPAFNAEASIGETLESTLAQTWPTVEIIVVDDGSRDRTADIVAGFAGRGVTLITQPNAGAAAARNRAYAGSTGRFIQWLDADDLLGPDKIARQMKVLLAAGDATVVAAGPWGRFLARPERAHFEPTGLWNDLPPAEWMIRRLESNAYMQTATWLVSRELSDRAGPWATDLLGDDDGEYFGRIMAKASVIRFVPDARVYYRMPSAGNLSYVGRSKAKLDAQLRSMIRTVACVQSLEDSPRARAACVTYLQNWLGFFHPEDADGVQLCATSPPSWAVVSTSHASDGSTAALSGR